MHRYGVWGDWERPYLTLEPKYEAAQLRVFGKLVAAGHIYRGTKPVHWSPSSQTALAEAELEYPEGHTSRSIYVAMPLESTGAYIFQQGLSWRLSSHMHTKSQSQGSATYSTGCVALHVCRLTKHSKEVALYTFDKHFEALASQQQ